MNVVMSSSSPTTGWTQSQCTQAAVNERFVHHFRCIVSSYAERSHRKSREDLGSGPWYSLDYTLALKEMGKEGRYKWVLEKDKCTKGLPPVGWTPSIHSKKSFHYQVGFDISAGQALENMKKKEVSFIDCGMAVQLAAYETLLEILGKERFDKLFGASHPTMSVNPFPLDLYTLASETALYGLGFFKRVKSDRKTTPPIFGESAYFFNHPLYKLKHPVESGGGWHTLCISGEDVPREQKKYLGFGLPKEGLTEEQIINHLIDLFNQPPLDLRKVFSEKRVLEMEKVIQDSRDAYFRKSNGVDVSSVQIDRKSFHDKGLEPDDEEAGLFSGAWQLDAEVIRRCLNPPKPHPVL
jgi:hypothetical protein